MIKPTTEEIHERTIVRLAVIWGSEGSIVKNAKEANEDCLDLLDRLEASEAKLEILEQDNE